MNLKNKVAIVTGGNSGIGMTEHDNDIVKIAVVGDEEWRDLVYAFLAKGFRQAEVEYFLPGDLAKARAWLGTDSR